MKTIYIVRWVARDGHASGEEQFTDRVLAQDIADARARRGHTVETLETSAWDAAILAEYLAFGLAGMCFIAVLLLLWLTR